MVFDRLCWLAKIGDEFQGRPCQASNVSGRLDCPYIVVGFDWKWPCFWAACRCNLHVVPLGFGWILALCAQLGLVDASFFGTLGW